MAYCDYEDVGLLLQFTFDTASNPTAAKVTTICGLIASEIEQAFILAGVGLPVAGSRLYDVTRLNNMYGAAGLVGVTYYRNVESLEGSQGDYYLKRYREFLEDVKKNPSLYNGLTGAGELYVSNQVLAGYETEDSITDVLIWNDWTA